MFLRRGGTETKDRGKRSLRKAGEGRFYSSAQPVSIAFTFDPSVRPVVIM